MERYYNKDIKLILENKYLIMLRLRLEELDQLIELTGGDEIVKEYKEALEEVTNDYEIAPYIEGERDRQMLYDGILQEMTEKATEEGRKKGIKEGREKGIKEGIKEGKGEIVNKLFSKGISIEKIADMLDMSQDIITSLLD